MSDYNWCHNPDCHKIETQSRVRGTGDNKVLRTRKIRVRDFSGYHWFQGWENHFCNVSCFFQFMKVHYQEVVNIAPVKKPSETPIQVVTTKSQDYRMRYNGNDYEKVPFTSTATTITLKNT